MGTKVGGTEPPPGQCRNLGCSRVPMVHRRQMSTLDSFGLWDGIDLEIVCNALYVSSHLSLINVINLADKYVC